MQQRVLPRLVISSEKLRFILPLSLRDSRKLMSSSCADVLAPGLLAVKASSVSLDGDDWLACQDKLARHALAALGVVSFGENRYQVRAAHSKSHH